MSDTRQELLGMDIPRDSLAADLTAVDARMRIEAPAADWTLYYADWFLAHRSP